MDGTTLQIAKDYFSIEHELRECSKGMKALREQKKKLGGVLLQWLQANGRKKIVFASKGVLERKTAKKKQSLDKAFLHQTVLAATGGNVNTAETIVHAAFNARPSVSLERLGVKLNSKNDEIVHASVNE